MSSVYKESSALLKLALPVSLAELATVGMSATDVLFAGQAGTNHLAGVSLGANAWNMVIFFFLGIGFATQPLIAHLYGAKNQEGVKQQFHQSLYLCIALGTIAMVAVWGLSLVVSKMNVANDFRPIAVNYIQIISLSAIPIVVATAVRGTIEGLGLTRFVLWVFLLVFLLNIPLDYVLVNGLYGFPRLGGVGCAWATVVLIWFALVFMLLGIVLHPKLKQYHYLSNLHAPNMAILRKTFRLGFPIGLSISIELAMFAGAGILASFFGSLQAGAHSVTITIASMSYMLFVGLGKGITIRASHFLGANQPSQAWYCIKNGIYLNVGFASATAVVFYVFPEFLVSIFNRDAQLIQLAARLMLFAAAFQLADAIQVSIICALRAYQDTKTPPFYQFVAFWLVAMPLGVYLAFYAPWTQLSGVLGLWCAMVVGLSLTSAFLLCKLLQLKRKHIDSQRA